MAISTDPRAVRESALLPITHLADCVVLASSSPRRAQALTDQSIRFEQLAPMVGENRRRSEDASDYVRRVATEKCEAIVRLRRNSVVIAADTTVVLSDGTVLHKPQSARQATQTLRRLRGRSCVALTGLTIGYSVSPKQTILVSSVVSSSVRFRRFGDAELSAYVATGEPIEKAGAFGIQGLGAALVANLSGCYSNVVGLPICELDLMLSLLTNGRFEALTCVTPEGQACPRDVTGHSEQRWLWRRE